MAICGCGYNRAGKKIKSCAKHKGKHHVSPRYKTKKAKKGRKGGGRRAAVATEAE